MAKEYINPNFNKKQSSALDIENWSEAIKGGDIVLLSKAITLIESENLEDQELARRLLSSFSPLTKPIKRIGITGSPGVGKSSFIEAYVNIHPKQSFAILAIDPSSQSSGGSILGDKTRMEKISGRDNVFIRPSPAGQTLGGIAAKTYETIFLCEQAGFDHIIIETVGVGQSETTVSQMVDLMILLLLPGAGDELQGIKRGIVELADIAVVTKNDEGREALIKNTIRSYKQALHLLRPKHEQWMTPVLTSSIFDSSSFGMISEKVDEFFQLQTNKISKLRHEQELKWLERTTMLYFQRLLQNSPQFEKVYNSQLQKLANHEISAVEAIRIINQYIKSIFDKMV